MAKYGKYYAFGGNENAQVGKETDQDVSKLVIIMNLESIQNADILTIYY